MRHHHSVIWTIIVFSFLALMGCAHNGDRDPATIDSDTAVQSGTTSGITPSTQRLLERNHGSGNGGSGRSSQMTFPQLQAPQLRSPAAVSAALGSPLLAGFSPALGTSPERAMVNAQPAWGWFVFAVAFLFALIYAARRSNARPDSKEPKFKT